MLYKGVNRGGGRNKVRRAVGETVIGGATECVGREGESLKDVIEIQRDFETRIFILTERLTCITDERRATEQRLMTLMREVWKRQFISPTLDGTTVLHRPLTISTV